jgi:hypothetical protein
MIMETARQNEISLILQKSLPISPLKDNSKENFDDEFTNVTADFDILNGSTDSIDQKKYSTLIQDQSIDCVEISLSDRIRRRRSLRSFCEPKEISKDLPVESKIQNSQKTSEFLSHYCLTACFICMFSLVFYILIQ